METKTQVMAMWFGDPVEEGLRVSADRQGWPVVRPRTVREAMMMVLCHRPRLVVAQLIRKEELGLAVIAVLHRRRQVSLLAVAGDDDPAMERQARAAGANCYLPGGVSAREVVRMVHLLLSRAIGPEHPRDAPVMEGRENSCKWSY
ncbi:MAG: hypothetical protein IT446_15100 [Phycisphaerales bacterium]|nr:hypothetical protein [Phycisphaerales bacterium]